MISFKAAQFPEDLILFAVFFDVRHAESCRDLEDRARVRPRFQRSGEGVGQDHRSIKKRVRPMPGFKPFASASATLEGIGVANMIRKGQLAPGLSPFAPFAALTA
ncbi:MAG: hypothetical protein C0524_20755 [Rhodobacter sp.]|nr:hypothetical protein [Rhodobacter sp.]